MNIPNVIIKDKASYVVISTTSPLYQKLGGYHLVHRLLRLNIITFSVFKNNIFTIKKIFRI